MKSIKKCVRFGIILNILFFVFFVCSCVSIFAFVSLAVLPLGIASSAVRLNIFAITAGTKKYRSSIRKKRKIHDKAVRLGSSKALIQWNDRKNKNP